MLCYKKSSPLVFNQVKLHLIPKRLHYCVQKGTNLPTQVLKLIHSETAYYVNILTRAQLNKK